MCQRPLGCIGVSSYPVGACCPVTIAAHARLRIAITIARIVFTPLLDQYVGRSVIAFPLECSADLRALHRIGDLRRLSYPRITRITRIRLRPGPAAKRPVWVRNEPREHEPCG